VNWFFFLDIKLTQYHSKTRQAMPSIPTQTTLQEIQRC
jgi:hypothetical protein